MHADSWAIKAKKLGYRSRAVFKLEEILNKLHKKKSLKNVLDLGSAPGGWSQYISVNYPSTNVIAIDVLDMQPIEKVTFIKDSIENIENIDEIDWDFVESSEVRASNANEDINFKKVIDKVKKERTTIGGIFQVIAFNVPLGLGSHTHWDNKLDGKIAQSMVSINAVKGVEIGNGFENTERWGREVQDVIEPNSSDVRNFSQISNNSGGIEGGMSNGNDIIVNVAIKPIATMTSPLPSVDIMTGEVVEAAYNRSDICQVSRACPVGEAMLALTLTEAVLEKFGGDSLQEIKRNYTSYIKTFKEYGK